MTASGGCSGATDRARHTFAARGGLLLVAAVQAEIGVWGLVAPRSLFTDFPGGGRHWISALGGYNEHLVRDYAAAELGVAVLLVGTAIWFIRPVVLVAGCAFLAATIPHLAYHLTTTGSFSTTDNIASVGGFVLEIAVVVLAMVAGARPAQGQVKHRS